VDNVVCNYFLFLAENLTFTVFPMAELWAEAQAEIKERIGKQNYDTWIKPIRFVSRNKNEMVVAVANKFFRDWVGQNYLSDLESVMSGIAKHDLKIVIEVDQNGDETKTQGKNQRKDEQQLDGNRVQIIWYKSIPLRTSL